MPERFCPKCGERLPETVSANAEKPRPDEASPINLIITALIIAALAWAVYTFLLAPTSVNNC